MCKNKMQQSEVTKINIDENWKFSRAGENNRLPATVPGTIHTDLMANKIIDDPYYRLNEHKLQWIDKVDWEYRTTFKTPAEIFDKDHIELIFDGLDTYADVYLNDELILKANNMFRTWTVDCKPFISKGKNTLNIYFTSPINIGLEKLEANGYPLPASNDQSENGELGDNKVSVFTRKAGYHFGWDWGPRLVTSGIWRPVTLCGWDDAIIKNVYVVQKNISEDKAQLCAKIEINSADFSDYGLNILVNGKKVAKEKIRTKPGTSVYKIDFTIPQPKLWWPNGLGEQNLYTITCEINEQGELVDKIDTQIGLRTIILVQEPDEDGEGRSFFFEVNGRPVFCKGANYIPNDVFLPRVSPEDYEHLVKSAAEANMNMLRVWGGGVYENDIFYDLCDKYGILVWQDFMFACSMYPGGEAFFDNVKQEAVDNVKRLRNHPCIALWCGNNEIEGAWGEYEKGRGWKWKERYTPAQRKEIWANYDTVFHRILPKVIKNHTEGQFYWHSSPSAGMGKLASYTTNSGDMHYWGVWHGQHPFSDFRVYKARFMSEYGFQSFPEFKTVKQYTIPSDRDIKSEVMASHQRSGIGNLRIEKYMENDYIIPDDFEQFLYVGQLLQAEGIKMAIEAHRTAMPYCMGTLYWQINDCWPVASWSGIDYFGRWKALHYFAKKAFKNVIVATAEEDDKLKIWIVSDFNEKMNATLKLRLIDFDGKKLWEKSTDIKTPQNSAKLYEEIPLGQLMKKGNKNEMALVTDLIVNNRLYERDIHYFAKPKYLTLSEPGLKIKITEEKENFKIDLTASKLAKNVFLSSENSDGRFSDNYFDILPGQQVNITYPKLCSLSDFESGLKVMHWQQTIGK